MKKSKFSSRKGGVKTLACKNCNINVHNVDEQTVSVTCWRCVCNGLNPNSAILSDMSNEEISILFNKLKNNGKSED